MKKIIITLCIFFISITPIFASNKFKVKLDKCVDGDTAKFIINDEVKTVRFLSINTPEIKHGANEAEAFGDEASKYTCEALTNAKSIKLQYDPKSEETDKYGRVLAWVFIDNELLQEKLIREGLAEVKYAYDDYLYTNELKSLELIAQDSHKGIWSIVNEISESVSDKNIMSKTELIISIVAIISIVIICVFGKNASSKKKAIKKIKKISGIWHFYDIITQRRHKYEQ